MFIDVYGIMAFDPTAYPCLSGWLQSIRLSRLSLETEYEWVNESKCKSVLLGM